MVDTAIKKDEIVSWIRTWHRIEPPNEVALIFAEDITAIPLRLADLSLGRFEDEPQDFASILEALADESNAA
jgi:hypothetical protein